MAIVPLSSPYSLKTAQLDIDVDDFTAAVSGVLLTPTSSSTTWRGIGGNVLTDQSISEWKVQIDAAQDLAPAGLQRYLLDHEGEKKTMVFTPTTAGPTVTVTVTLTPGQIGGAADGNVTTFTSTMPADGKPVFDDGTP